MYMYVDMEPGSLVQYMTYQRGCCRGWQIQGRWVVCPQGEQQQTCSAHAQEDLVIVCVNCKGTMFHLTVDSGKCFTFSHRVFLLELMTRRGLEEENTTYHTKTSIVQCRRLGSLGSLYLGSFFRSQALLTLPDYTLYCFPIPIWHHYISTSRTIISTLMRLHTQSASGLFYLHSLDWWLIKTKCHWQSRDAEVITTDTS